MYLHSNLCALKKVSVAIPKDMPLCSLTSSLDSTGDGITKHPQYKAFKFKTNRWQINSALWWSSCIINIQVKALKLHSTQNL